MKKQKRNNHDNSTLPKKLNPNIPEERKLLIKQAVINTFSEYGEALKKLGSE